jgi:hypothetical protein
MKMQATETPTIAEAKALARDAFLFGLPPVYIAQQIDQMTNVPRPMGTHAPINQFAHYRDMPNANNREVVGINLDTLYSLASLDLSGEPIVLSVPEMGDRYWIMQVIDAWNEVPQAPGSRTVGGKGGHFAIVGPGWNGKLPQGLAELRVGTEMAMIGGRTYTAGQGDSENVHALQDRYGLTPLSGWGREYAPPENVPVKPGVDTRTTVPKQVMAMTAEAFFSRLNALLKGNPPHAADAPFMERIERIGIIPGAAFGLGELPAEVRKAIDEGVASAKRSIQENKDKGDAPINGWQVNMDMGRYGTRYAYRAVTTFYAVGGNLAEDAIYPIAMVDGEGRTLNGANRYELRFPKGALPPAEAFWSLTLYDADSFLVPNPINRYSLGDRNDLKVEADGSLTIFIQSEAPGQGKEPNWLPAPENQDFKIAMRLYSPGKEATTGTWKPPAIKRI